MSLPTACALIMASPTRTGILLLRTLAPIGRPKPVIMTMCLVSIMTAASGCQKASDEQCEQVANKMVELALAETPHGEAGEAAAQAMRTELASKCFDDRPTPEQVQCLLAATSRAAVADC